jgi:predicted alpha-1,6-mannanase (GH76 family)
VDAAAAALLLHRWDQAGGDDEVVYRALTARYLADLAGVPDG